MGRFNKWMMLVVYPFYLYLVNECGSCCSIVCTCSKYCIATLAQMKSSIPGSISLQVCHKCFLSSEKRKVSLSVDLLLHIAMTLLSVTLFVFRVVSVASSDHQARLGRISTQSHLYLHPRRRMMS